jgi:NAD+ diphosphatase
MEMPPAYPGCRLDRAPHLRADPLWLEKAERDPESRFLPVSRGCNLVLMQETPRAAVLTRTDAAALLQRAEATAFLGLGNGRAWFAVDVGADGEAEALARRAGGRFLDLRRISGSLPRNDAAALAYARALTHWQRSQRYCNICGARTVSAHGGHMRICSAPACETRHFPRTDPAVIVLVTRDGPDGGACLLARQPRWPEGLLSTLAGFVEPGETLEETVVREVAEEVGIRVTGVRYCGSQPWPFPASLMLAFRAEAGEDAEIVLRCGELEEAHWLTREDLGTLAAIGRKLPPRDSIGREMIECWRRGEGRRQGMQNGRREHGDGGTHPTGAPE